MVTVWFGKPMVCVRVAFHENDRNREGGGGGEDGSDGYERGVGCWIHGNHGNHENYENHGNSFSDFSVNGVLIGTMGPQIPGPKSMGHSATG